MNSHNTQNNYLNLNKDRYINSPLTYSNHYYSIVIICQIQRICSVVECYCCGIFCARSVLSLTLISRGTVRYRRTALDFQSPKILMSSRGRPTWKANEAPPRRKEWEPKSIPWRPHLLRHERSLVMKNPYVKGRIVRDE